MIQRLAESFKTFNFNPFNIFEIAIYFVFIALAFKVLKDNNAKKLIVYYCIFTILGGIVLVAAHLMDDSFHGGVVMLCLQALFFVATVLLFSTEVKRAIWDKRSPSSGRNARQISVKRDTLIDEIIKAVQNMSKNDVGAIIILSDGNLPEAILDSGVYLNADISSQLIESIFFPKTALHDGAMVLCEKKIQAAGCFLPPAQEVNIPKELGSRHRAGIGITEAVNVTAIIVSEETGIISIANGGKITRYVDTNTLKNVLKQFFWKDDE